DEVGAGGHGEDAGAAHAVVGAELAGLEDDLEVARAARFFDGDDFLVDLFVVAGEEGAAVDDHVDLVGAGFDGLPRLGDLDRGEALAGGEGGGDRRDAGGAAPGG